MIDKKFLKSIFSGDNTAFTRFYRECRTLFLAYFSKLYPTTKVSLTDLYQDSIMEFWSQIVDGKITEERLKCPPSTYVISIGINKMRAGYRKVIKENNLLETLKEHPHSFRVSVLDSFNAEDQDPLDSLYVRGENENKLPLSELDDTDERRRERLQEWSDFLKQKYEDMGYPCAMLLRYTWYNDMTDKEILEEFEGHFSNTDVIKTKRHKCHKTLLNMFNAWKSAQNKIRSI